MNPKIKVIIKRPDEPRGHVCWIGRSLENLQKTVGGYIEVFPLTGNCTVICDEDGKMKGRPYNCSFYEKAFVGTIIVAGLDEKDFTDVPEGVIGVWKQGKLLHSLPI